MGLFNFFKKKKNPIEIQTSQTPQSIIDANNQKELEQSRKQKDILTKKHEANLARIDLNDLPISQENAKLSDLEIDFLSYINKKKIQPLKIARPWTEQGLDFQTTLRKFFACGLMEIASDCFAATDKGQKIIDEKVKRDLDNKFRTASTNSHKHLQVGDLHSYREDLVAIAEVYMDEQRYHDALQVLCMVFVLDASGAPTPGLVQRNQEWIRDGFAKKGEFIGYDPIIVQYPIRLIDKTISKLGLSNAEIEGVFRDTITQEQIPLGFCSTDEFADLFMCAVRGDGNADALVEKYKRRFITRYAK